MILQVGSGQKEIGPMPDGPTYLGVDAYICSLLVSFNSLQNLHKHLIIITRLFLFLEII